MRFTLPPVPTAVPPLWFVILPLPAMISCLPFKSSVDAGISFPTTPVEWPAETACVSEGVRETAFELLSTESFTVVVNEGERSIAAADWPDYAPSGSWNKNSTRNLLFTDQCFSRSPQAPNDCQGDDCKTVVDVDGYTWMELSQILSIDCIPSGRACNPNGLGAGELAVIVTRKCHQLTFEGAVTFLNGPNGERAIQHAYGESGAPSFEVGLPPGWTLTSETLAEPLVIYPVGAGGDCFFPIIRDELQQSYHQFEFGSATYP